VGSKILATNSAGRAPSDTTSAQAEERVMFAFCRGHATLEVSKARWSVDECRFAKLH
jgi:hypothetical protein